MHEAGQRVQGWEAKSSPSALGTSHGAEQGAKKCPVLGEQQTSAGQCWLGYLPVVDPSCSSTPPAGLWPSQELLLCFGWEILTWRCTELLCCLRVLRLHGSREAPQAEPFRGDASKCLSSVQVCKERRAGGTWHPRQ